MNDISLLINTLAQQVEQLQLDLQSALSRISVLEQQLATPLEEATTDHE